MEIYEWCDRILVSRRSLPVVQGRPAGRVFWGSANFLTRKSCACKHTASSERGRPNNNSPLLRPKLTFLSHSLPARLDQYPSLGPLPPVLIRSWNLWRTHIRDVRPICAPNPRTPATSSPFRRAVASNRPTPRIATLPVDRLRYLFIYAFSHFRRCRSR